MNHVLSRLIDGLQRLGTKAISSGNFGLFVVMIVGGAIVWKLDSKDLKEVLLAFAERLQWFGFPVAFLTIYVCKRTLDWRESIHQAELDRLAKIRDQLVAPRIEQPL
jgi:hypothetical protein